MTSRVELTLTGTMDHLALVWLTGQTILESVEFEEEPEETRYNVLLALQEMLTNVLRHAYGGEAELPIRVEFEFDASSVAIELADRGVPFDPSEHVPQTGDPEAMPTQVGGYGILIAQMVMDELSYERRDDWNVLRMVKSVRSQGGTFEVNS